MPDAGATQVEARSMAPAAYPKDSSGGLVAGFLAAVSVVLVAVVAVMLIDRIEELDGSIEDKLSDFRRDLGNTEGRLVERFNDAQAAYLVSSSGLSSDIGSLKEARLEDNRLLRERLDETVRGVENLRERMGAMALTEREVADHARSIAGINAALSAIDLDLGQLAKDLADRPSVV
ncbi:MAG: methyl-accepting chemotaxis protein, partial [Planctomycetota bacterium]